MTASRPRARCNQVKTARKGKGMELQYSGVLSRPFWNIISTLPRKDSHYLYVMGCNLQDIEARTLRALNEARAAAKKRKGTK